MKEQLKVIQKELGISKDDRTSDAEEFAERLQGKVLSEATQKRIDEGTGTEDDEVLVSAASAYTTIDGVEISHSDIQDALLRSNKEFDIGAIRNNTVKT